ncbi:MAG: hypothetical protein PUB51_03260 [Oscillospiraceae bacterium]|nr:hypothetical protein [Oscillospiraceae bacterium]
MSNELVRLMLEVRSALLVTVGMTLAAYLILLLCIRRLQVQGRGTRLAGLFVGLGGRSMLHLGFAWLKFAFFASCLLLAQPVMLTHYLLLGVLTVGALLVGFSLKAMLTEIVGGGLLIAGLAVCTTLLQYLRQIRYDKTILAAYWMLSVFLILCAAVVLMREVIAVSGERKDFDESGESE